MGTIYISKIMDAIRRSLFDINPTRWTNKVLFEVANDALQALPSLKQDILTKNEPVQLEKGIKQRLPERGIQFVRVGCNMGVDGATPGMMPQKAEDLDRYVTMNRGWHKNPPSPTVDVWIHEEKDGKHFYVDPPQPETLSERGYVDLVYYALPDVIVPDGTDPNTMYDIAMPIDDVWEQLLKTYMLYICNDMERAHSTAAAANTLSYWNVAVSMVDRKDLLEKTDSPDQNGNGQ